MADKWTIQIIRTMSTKERSEFLEFFKVESNDRSQNAHRLFELLLNPKTRDQQDKFLWIQLHEEKPYTANTMRGYHSFLLSKLKEYLIWLSFQKDPQYQDLALLQQFRRRGLSKLFENHFKSTEGQYKESLRTDEDIFLYHFHRQVEYHNQIMRKPRRNLQNNLSGISSAFNQWWILQKLIIACTNLSSEQINGRPTEDIWFTAMLEFIDSSEEINHIPLINLYRKLYDLLQKDAAGLHTSLRQLLNQYRDTLPHKRLRLVYELLLNDLLRELKKNDSPQLLQRTLEQYEWGVSDRLLYVNGYIKPQHFKNYVSAAARLNDYSKAVRFMHAHNHEIEPQFRSQMLSLCFAIIRFEMGKFEQIKKKLAAVEFVQLFFAINVRMILLKVEYELEFQSELLVFKPKALDIQRKSLADKITVFMNYIRSHKSLAEKEKEPLLNRLKFFRRLVNARTLNKLQTLRYDLDHTFPLDNRSWLVQKVDKRIEIEYGIPPAETGGTP